MNKVRILVGLVLAVVFGLPVHAEPVVEYIHTDALGTPIAVTDENGNVIERYEYEPYGLQVAGPVEDGPGFTGHVEDTATGLTYMQQRYYDPQIGRFLSIDPVTAYGNPVDQFNRYWYAGGNPYMYTDPDGRCFAPPVAAGCAAVGAGLAVLGAAVVASTPQGQAAMSSLIATGGDNFKGNVEWLTGIVLNEAEGGDLPEGLVGEQDGKGGSTKGRHNSGPLAPENGGSGNADEDFETLTGGKNGPRPDGSKLPEGSRVGENGVVLRPGKNGPRIDIPENGDKPRETLHYPPEKTP